MTSDEQIQRDIKALKDKVSKLEKLVTQLTEIVYLKHELDKPEFKVGYYTGGDAPDFSISEEDTNVVNYIGTGTDMVECSDCGEEFSLSNVLLGINTHVCKESTK